VRLVQRLPGQRELFAHVFQRLVAALVARTVIFVLHLEIEERVGFGKDVGIVVVARTAEDAR
jgi:hypothetical protein